MSKSSCPGFPPPSVPESPGTSSPHNVTPGPWNVHPGTDRDNGPAVVDDTIYWRTYRYNVYDILAYDTTTGGRIWVCSPGTSPSAVAAKYLPAACR